MSEIQLKPLPLRCVECGADSDDRARGWQAQLGGGYDGDDVEIGFYCPDCAAREFGDDEEGWRNGRLGLRPSGCAGMTLRPN